MEQFTIKQEDLTGLSGKVVVITGKLLASFSIPLACMYIDLTTSRGLVRHRPRNSISVAGAWGVSRGW